MDSGIEVPTRTSLTDSQVERYILNKFETGENVNIECSNCSTYISKGDEVHTTESEKKLLLQISKSSR